MAESPVPKSQYAVQIALQILKDRCVQLQKRVVSLEEENVGLKQKNLRPSENMSPHSLEIRVSRLTEEKKHLKNTIALVATENKQLWSNLSKLSSENKCLGARIGRISKTLHGERIHAPLSRSKTFTQEAPQSKQLQKVLAENELITFELEDISLKLQDSVEKETSELVQQMDEMSSLTEELNSLGFDCMEEEVDESIIESIEQHLLEMKNIKSMLKEHADKLKNSVHELEAHKETEQAEKRKVGQRATKTVQVDIIDANLHVMVDKSVDSRELDCNSSDREQEWGTPEASFALDKAKEKTCPMCNQTFGSEIDFTVFTRHVEDHFKDNGLFA